MSDIQSIKNSIITCQQCPRLRSYCEEVARVKKKAHLHESYWGKPIPGFGDPAARLFIVGLAPAAHGANRTGRIFTGDRSGEWLYRALYKAGFSNQAVSQNAGDSLILRDTFISCAVGCAPPDNLPTPEEKEKCLPFLEAELQALKNVKAWIALGRIAFDQLWPLLHPTGKKPKFQHGMRFPVPNGTLFLSYHPSQQNTFTGRLTEPMFDQVFSDAKSFLENSCR